MSCIFIKSTISLYHNKNRYPNMTRRVRIIHPHDINHGKIGKISEVIDQHSGSTYVVLFKGSNERRAYQRHDIKFLKSYNSKLRIWI